MPREFSIRESAGLLGVAPSTISRHLPGSRRRHGRRAALTMQEVIDLAPEVGKDTETIRRKIQAIGELGPSMPAEAQQWLEIGEHLDLTGTIARHEARIPRDYWSRLVEPLTDFTFPTLPIEGVDWQPLTVDEVDEIIPPIHE